MRSDLLRAKKCPTWGWCKARWRLLQQPDWGGAALDRKRVRRIWRAEELTCKPKVHKKRRAGPDIGEEKRVRNERPMNVVNFDFQFVVTWYGCHVRFFSVIDDTCVALAIIPRRSFTANDVVIVFENIFAETDTVSTRAGSDSEPESTAAALIDWCATAGVETVFIDPGAPWQNGFAESFNAHFRREQLTGEAMDIAAEVRHLADEWKENYNN